MIIQEYHPKSTFYQRPERLFVKVYPSEEEMIEGNNYGWNPKLNHLIFVLPVYHVSGVT